MVFSFKSDIDPKLVIHQLPFTSFAKLCQIVMFFQMTINNVLRLSYLSELVAMRIDYNLVSSLIGPFILHTKERLKTTRVTIL